MHACQIACVDGAHKHHCWVIIEKDADPLKPYELGFSQNSANEGTANTKNKPYWAL